MRPKQCVILVLLVAFLTGCGSGTSVAYVQAEGLPQPDSICIENNSAELIFEPEDEEFQRVYDILMQTWWQTVEEAPDTVSASDLRKAGELKELKTSNWRTYRTSGDIFAVFRYSDGLEWTDFEGKTIQVQSVFFLIPRYQEDCEYIKGYFSASESGDIGINEGMYTFYYPAEITDGFVHWVIHK